MAESSRRGAEQRPLGVVSDGDERGYTPRRREHPFDLEGGWRVVICVEDGGIVSEVRVFPTGAASGQSDATCDPALAATTTPRGGLVTAVWRSIPLGQLAAEARSGRQTHDDILTEVYGDFLGELPERQPGPKGYDEGFYAELASKYVEFVRAGHSKPVDGLARVYKVSRKTMEGRLARLRKEPWAFLTKPAPGVAGGELTEAGRAAVARLMSEGAPGRE